MTPNATLCVSFDSPNVMNAFKIVLYRVTWFYVTHILFVSYRKGTSIRQAPVFRHLRALRKSPWKFIIWMN